MAHGMWRERWICGKAARRSVHDDNLAWSAGVCLVDEGVDPSDDASNQLPLSFRLVDRYNLEMHYVIDGCWLCRMWANLQTQRCMGRQKATVFARMVRYVLLAARSVSLAWFVRTVLL